MDPINPTLQFTSWQNFLHYNADAPSTDHICIPPTHSYWSLLQGKRSGPNNRHKYKHWYPIFHLERGLDSIWLQPWIWMSAAIDECQIKIASRPGQHSHFCNEILCTAGEGFSLPFSFFALCKVHYFNAVQRSNSFFLKIFAVRYFNASSLEGSSVFLISRAMMQFSSFKYILHYRPILC